MWVILVQRGSRRLGLFGGLLLSGLALLPGQAYAGENPSQKLVRLLSQYSQLFCYEGGGLVGVRSIDGIYHTAFTAKNCVMEKGQPLTITIYDKGVKHHEHSGDRSEFRDGNYIGKPTTVRRVVSNKDGPEILIDDLPPKLSEPLKQTFKTGATKLIEIVEMELGRHLGVLPK